MPHIVILITEILCICIGYVVHVRNLSTVILLLYIMSFSPRFQSSVSTTDKQKLIYALAVVIMQDAIVCTYVTK